MLDSWGGGTEKPLPQGVQGGASELGPWVFSSCVCFSVTQLWGLVLPLQHLFGTLPLLMEAVPVLLFDNAHITHPYFLFFFLSLLQLRLLPSDMGHTLFIYSFF